MPTDQKKKKKKEKRSNRETACAYIDEKPFPLIGVKIKQTRERTLLVRASQRNKEKGRLS